MTAHERFRDLGYKLKQSTDYSIDYVKKTRIDYIHNTKRTIEKHINFEWQDNEGVEIYETIFDRKFFKKTTKAVERPFLSAGEIEAIYLQMVELGW